MDSLSEAAAVEKKVRHRLAAAGIRLRSDKVAVRLVHNVKAGVAEQLPADQSIAFTVTAPIKLPAKTSAVLKEWLPRVSAHQCSTTIYSNEVRARILHNTGTDVPKVIGFVHDPKTNADLVLDIVQASFHEQGQL